jgi:dTDP-4-dehydrorhamnose 3,5-epimerase
MPPSVTPARHADARGFFEESWSARDFRAIGIATEFVQDNHSLSRTAGTLRGMHCQAPPHAQAKMVRCAQGAICDVVVDIRRGSPSFGRWAAFELSAENGRQLFVPKGFLHGFVTLQPDTQVQYRCSDYHAPECDRAVRWDSLGIDWPLADPPILSDRDAAAVPLAEFDSPFTFGDTP